MKRFEKEVKAGLMGKETKYWHAHGVQVIRAMDGNTYSNQKHPDPE